MSRYDVSAYIIQSGELAGRRLSTLSDREVRKTFAAAEFGSSDRNALRKELRVRLLSANQQQQCNMPFKLFAE
jgi:hypothetical protein